MTYLIKNHKECVPNKTLNLNMHVFDIITRKNESKISTKDISCKCKCKFDERKCNSNQKWNNDEYRYECKKHYICEKDDIWNSAACSCNGKYLASIVDDSVITRDAIIEEIKTVPTNFNEKE